MDGLHNWDLALGKTFRFGERVNAQLRGEFFNTTNTARFSGPATVLNSADGKGRTIFTDGKGSCYVELPFGPLKPGELRPPGTPPPHEAVTCTAHMKDPAWKKCEYGTMHTNPSGSQCVCFRMGNPPPPPWKTDCPKTKP